MGRERRDSRKVSPEDMIPGYIRFKETGREPDEEALIQLAAWVVKQAAIDYRSGLNGMERYDPESQDYRDSKKLKNEVIRFSKSKWFRNLCPDPNITSEKFLSMAVNRQIAGDGDTEGEQNASVQPQENECAVDSGFAEDGSMEKEAV